MAQALASAALTAVFDAYSAAQNAAGIRIAREPLLKAWRAMNRARIAAARALGVAVPSVRVAKSKNSVATCCC
jgi:hypothetical protein